MSGMASNLPRLAAGGDDRRASTFFCSGSGVFSLTFQGDVGLLATGFHCGVE
jgi:hypothetical protein